MLNYDISALRHGSPRQQAAHAALTDCGIFTLLAPYRPALAGTIPLGIDVPESDLDVLCEVSEGDLWTFAERLRAAFGGRRGFALRLGEADGLPVVVCRFWAGGFPIEVFGQPRPVTAQNAYRHMQAEGRLLAMAGADAIAAIRGLKAEGLKTEPAFAEHFTLPGDPYRTLYELSDAPDAVLRQAIERGAAAREACIFCRIVRGAAKASIVHRDPFTLAFMNLRQANAGHVLVIPRRHVETVYELDDSLAGRLARTVVRVSRGVRAAMEAEGLSIWQANGEAAFQEVPHVHVHLFPRRKGDGYLRVYPSHPPPQSPATLDALAAKIRAAL